MKLISIILISVVMVSCEGTTSQKENAFSNEVYEIRAEVTVRLSKGRFQVESQYLRKPGTNIMNYVREIIITNHSNKLFLVGSNLPEHKVVSSSEVKGFSTRKMEWRYSLNENIIDSFFYELASNTTDTFKIIDPLDGLDSVFFSIEIHEKGKLAKGPKMFFLHKGILK